MAIVLLSQLIAFMIMILMGYGLVRAGAVKSEESRLLSVLTIYFLMPCGIIKSFQIHLTEEIMHGMLLAVAAAILVHLLYWAMLMPGRKFMKWDAVECGSIMYPNSGNLILPIVPVLLGDEWLIYCSAFMSVQTIFMWTHCISMFSSDGFQLKKIMKNLNVWAIIVGMLLCVLPFELPAPLTSVVTGMSAMLAPAAMLTVGMLLASMDMKSQLKNLRIYKIAAIRLIVCPLLVLFVIWISKAASFDPNGKNILLITLLACMAPPASSITQISQVYGGDAVYASSVNSLSLLGCVITMPAITALYMMLIH